MKRELKLRISSAVASCRIGIAKPIPMKRELKPGYMSARLSSISHCKAYPDEKGIETERHLTTSADPNAVDCKAYPDEKGIETPRASSETRNFRAVIAKPIPMKRELKHGGDSYQHFRDCQNCKAYPDEKGIETCYPGIEFFALHVVLQSLSR